MRYDLMSKSFLAVGDYLINPDLLAYAILENDGAEPRLRLGFAMNLPHNGGELRLAGEEAREVLRWLRLNSTFLSRGGGFGSLGRTADPAIDSESQSISRKVHATIAEGWEPLSKSQSEQATSFRRRAPSGV
jgi:hypothetical protein